jgi:glutamate carboxypeptidase
VTSDEALVDLLHDLTGQQPAMVDMLEALVASESPSEDPGMLAATADLVAELGERLLGVPAQRLGSAESPALRWELAPVDCDVSPIVLLAHLDTVWPAGTSSRWPFTVEGDRATGPGAFDMKAGLVQAMYALAALARTDLAHPPVVLLVTSDEEVGSPTGRELVEACSRGACAVLVLEASADGALKVARKGVSNYRLLVTGRAAHAGLEPEKGVNALVAAAHLVLALDEISDPEVGTTVTPTLATAGSAQNTVPATARVAIDVRCSTSAEQDRVDRALRHLRTPTDAVIAVEGGVNRPPLEERASSELFDLAQRAARRCGLTPLRAARVGGGSDGNFTAALGVPTLDGLGAVGAGAHAEGEYVLTTAMPERAALLAALIVELRGAADEAFVR